MGRAAHMAAASKGGARYDDSMTPEQRSDISNAIFLCANCADIIDDNLGKDYPIDVLRNWKTEHEKWVRDNLNRTVNGESTTINVTTHNQTGGIAAGIVNIGQQQRRGNPKLYSDLDKEFPDNAEKVQINHVAGSNEAFNLATEIRNYFIGRGFSVPEIGSEMRYPPIKGIELNIKRSPKTITVGYI
jgi:hypothetical protein